MNNYYILAAIMFISAIWFFIAIPTLWANGLEAMKVEAKRGSNVPGHYWDHLDGDDG